MYKSYYSKILYLWNTFSLKSVARCKLTKLHTIIWRHKPWTPDELQTHIIQQDFENNKSLLAWLCSIYFQLSLAKTETHIMSD